MKKVLILTASYGSGHVIAAKALDESFRKKGITPVVFDIVLEGGRFEKAAAGFYELLMKRGHFVWRLYHKHVLPINKGNSIRAIYSYLHKNKFFKEIEKINPDLIVSTMDSASVIASLYASTHPNVKIATVLTDYEAHPVWVWKNMDYYFIGSAETKEYLIEHGIDLKKITVSGIPIRSQFQKLPSKKNARKKLGIPEDKTVLLLSAGTFGSVPILSVIKSVSMLENMYVIILAGRKKNAVVTYADILKSHGLDGKVMEYTDEMEVVMRASDLYISKAGGLTVAECLACSLPAIYINNFPGHEVGNAEYAAGKGAAFIVHDNNALLQKVEGLLKDHKKLEEMRENAQKTSTPSASDTIISHLV